MGFYRFIKKTIRFILYQMPKKWLIMIIFAMAMTFGLTQVKAASYVDSADIDTNNLTFYEYLDIKNNYFDTGINASVGTSSNHNNRAIYIEYLQSGKMYSVAVNINEDMGNNAIPYNSSESGIELQQENNPAQSWFRVNRKWSTQKIFNLSNNTKHELHLNFIDRYASIDGTMYDFSSYISDFYTSHTLYLNSNPSYLANTFRVYYMEVDELINNGQTISVLHKYYPSRYVDSSNPLTVTTYNGFYDTTTGDFLIFVTGNNATFGNEVESPIPPTPEEPTNPDYTEDLNNINNSINDTNDFLKDTNVNTNDKNLPSPTIENSQVISQVDNAYSDFFEDYLLLFASELPVVIELYIPNMSTGGIASTIRIPSTYVKEHLSSLSIPFINYSMLELVHMVWYVLFAFWFLGFATNLVTILYSGEIMQDKGLSKLTKTYTGVSKNML